MINLFSRPVPGGPINTVLATSLVGPLFFNGGTPMSSDSALVVDNSIPTFFAGGLGYTRLGALCVTLGGAITARAPGGAPIGPNGRLCCSVGVPIVSYMNGIGCDAAGRVVINNPV